MIPKPVIRRKLYRLKTDPTFLVRLISFTLFDAVVRVEHWSKGLCSIGTTRVMSPDEFLNSFENHVSEATTTKA